MHACMYACMHGWCGLDLDSVSIRFRFTGSVPRHLRLFGIQFRFSFLHPAVVGFASVWIRFGFGSAQEHPNGSIS